tara:strand:- start:4155 stop:5522 length:1368 start_codon:yes stop_codon:yes gene_type:complete
MKTIFFRSISVVALCIFFFSCKTRKVAVNEKEAVNQHHFVKVNGTNFTVKDKPYYFVGTNFWYGAYLGAEAGYGDRERLLRELDQLQELGINNLRIVAASEESDFGLPLSPPFQYKNGEYNETLLQGLDFLLAEMGKRNLRAVMVLNNFWDWSGGMAQYVSWATGDTVKDPATNKEHTWDQYIDFSARFYQIEASQKLYKKYIGTLINRTNIYTKETYKNDTAIMSWELANEPRPLKDGYSNNEENVKDFSKWVHETAAYIHSEDPNHLVTTGSEGSKGTLNELKYAKQAHESEFIDYTTFHLWPKNWGWYKADKPETMESTKKHALEYIKEHIKMSKQLNKPTVLEEIGFVRDGEMFSADSPVTARNEFYGFILDLLQKSIDEGNAMKGLNFWGWGGEGRAQQSDYMWKPGDIIYTADPYSEAQGLNSIYNTDVSTFDVISKVAHELERLSSKP